MPRPAPSRVAAALNYLERLRNQAAEFGGGVVENLADRARSAGELAYEALTSDPAIGRMTTAEFSEAANRPTPRLDQAARDIGTIGRAIVTQPIQTGKAIVQGEVERAREAMSSPRAAGQYAGSFIDPMRIAAALRKTAPVLELDVYHGTPHRFPATEANPLGEFDASKIGTGEGAQAYGHGVYLAESPGVANAYKTALEAGKGDRDEDVIARLLAATKGDRAATAEEFRRRAEFANYPEGKQRMLSLAEKVESGVDPRGSLYKADLPDEMIDRMLDWDKPIKDQPETVQNAMRQAFGEYAVKYAIGNEMDWKRFQSMFGFKNEADFSERLRQAGIPGIKYLDAGSRGQGGSGTRNFVVFPGEEKKVRILERK